MGWMQKCYETYENNIHMAGRLEAEQTMLCPPNHTVLKAQIEISVSADGEFITACEIPKSDSDTVIPITENSAVRTSGVSAHMLCDQLKYIALGNKSYPHREKYKKFYDDYMENLSSWVENDPGNKKLSAIYSYCKGGSIIKDLEECGLVETDEDGILTNGKTVSTPYEKCLVRWRVPGADECDQVWLDTKLFDSHNNHMRCRNESSDVEKDLCYISGKVSTVQELHQKGIVKTYAGTSLISANDERGFTFRGRFEDKKEALTISAEVSQKAHAALRWLAANQGKVYGGRKGARTYICWNPKGKTVPPVSFSPYDNDEEQTPDYALTKPEYKEKIGKALNGIRQEFEQNDDVVIISLDSATGKGRLAVTYYNELKASDFLDRIERWNNSCCWMYKRYDSKKGKTVSAVMTPSILKILDSAYGTEQKNMVRADEDVVRDQYQRIFRCISEAQALPPDIVHQAVIKASKPTAYSKRENWNQVISTACALVRKYYNDKMGKEVYSMAVDYENTDRSYLFGRLLAVLEKVEDDANKNSGVQRETNAMRYRSAFVQHPGRTWKILEGKLGEGYFSRLSPGLTSYYKGIISEIVSKMDIDNHSKLNASLSDVYLLGYYLQRDELYKRKNSNTEKREGEK